MKIVNKSQFNTLEPEEGKVLLDKTSLEAYNAEEDIDKKKLYTFSVAYLPKTVTLGYCLEHYVEVDNEENIHK